MFGQDNDNDQNQQDNQGYGVQPADNPASLGSDDAAGQDYHNTTPASDAPPVAPAVVPTSPSTSIGGADDLLRIKQEALQHLSPLVGHLDQSAEEKFKTTMMMIQAADDQSLVSAAYETAKLIEDEKARAQALLDIINEINYFTQKNKEPS